MLSPTTPTSSSSLSRGWPAARCDNRGPCRCWEGQWVPSRDSSELSPLLIWEAGWNQSWQRAHTAPTEAKLASTTSDHGAVYCGRQGSEELAVNPLSNIFLLGYSVSKALSLTFSRALLCLSLGKINNANQDFLCLFTCCQVSSISSLNSTRRKFRAGCVSNSLTDSAVA